MAKHARPAVAPRKPARSTSASTSAARSSKPAQRPAKAVKTGGNGTGRGAKGARPVKAALRAKPAAKHAPEPQGLPQPNSSARPKPLAVAANDPGRKAIEVFEKGFQALHQRQFAQAAEILSSLVASYPDEKELHERARVYLAICERRGGAAAAPRTFEERMCAATLAINRGESAQGVSLLRDLERDHPDHDHVQYLLALGHAATGDTEKAVRHLRRAIELRPSNRLQAQQDVDLDGLRNDPAFLALLEGLPARGR